jgi:hypothetical protein
MELSSFRKQYSNFLDAYDESIGHEPPEIPNVSLENGELVLEEDFGHRDGVKLADRLFLQLPMDHELAE